MMDTPDWILRRLNSVNPAQINALADVLIDCVNGGASVSFMRPLTLERAVAFWQRVAHGVAAGERALLIAQDIHGICGTVASNYRGAAFTVLGVFLGSALWWLILSTSIGLLHHRMSTRSMIWVNRLSGMLMAALGAFAFAKR